MSDSINEEKSQISDLIRQAEQGDADAQILLGCRYESGDGIPQDDTKAQELYERAAAQGSTFAMCILGGLYAFRDDNEKARYWFEQAAAHGGIDDDSLIDLANLYYVDEDVPQNYKKSLKWYERAAVRGNTWAMVRLGDLYADGLGSVRHSYVMAQEWYERAAAAGSDEAMYNLGFMYEEGEDYEMAREWYEKAAAEGNPKAKSSLRELNENTNARSTAA